MADKEDLDALQALAQGKKGKTETARLRELLPAIEATFRTGVSRQVVFETLKERGFTFSFASFVSTLYYLRKERTTKAPSLSSPQPTPQPSQPNSKPIPQPSPKPSAVAPPSTQKPQESKVTDKDREEYEAFMESIKHLPEKEQRKKHAQYLVARRSRL